MKKTLLLCFIHGFKGGDDTFGNFPEHLRALLSHALPNLSVAAVTYPKFETRGDLKDCVGRFREWLSNRIIDLEVASSTPSPTIDPSVRTILIGHSMGGIVAADTLLAIASDPPIVPAPSSNASQPSSAPLADDAPPAFMFPYIQGLLAFDTPYLGIAPGVVAHGAETHLKTASSAYGALSEIAGVLGWGGSAGTAANPAPSVPNAKQKALTAGPSAGANEAMAASATAGAGVPAWQRWGKVAMIAGAAGAMAAGGAAAYIKRDTITEGWTWVGSHLEFVGCLMRGEELKTRLAQVLAVKEERGVGFADLVTALGKGAAGVQQKTTTVAGGWVEIGGAGPGAGAERTFCSLPRRGEMRRGWEVVRNEKAGDEMVAHTSMFWPREHPGYYAMSERAKELIVSWVDEGWYASSE
ncbi:MAG: hypothetical protein FRX48_07648 [Lasallia pustulata]|uniref:AB hydrolase-1 domain-containing protein n=1 Tax=Lasallia pustulata TaxID=136370 RepID=A0A5M8PI80_9LECA|nr:MAG: hypothetical protein FRX48_07648 [Lasallia pustulata]